MAQASVLLVECDKPYIDTLTQFFELKGIDVSIANEGNAGITQAGRSAPTLIVLAVELPTISGYSVCKKLKRDKNTLEIPLVLISATATSETFEQHRRLRTRADHYILKPFTPEQLWSEVETYFPDLAPPAEAEVSGASVNMLDDLAMDFGGEDMGFDEAFDQLLDEAVDSDFFSPSSSLDALSGGSGSGLTPLAASSQGSLPPPALPPPAQPASKLPAPQPPRGSSGSLQRLGGAGEPASRPPPPPTGPPPDSDAQPSSSLLETVTPSGSARRPVPPTSKPPEEIAARETRDLPVLSRTLMAPTPAPPRSRKKVTSGEDVGLVSSSAYESEGMVTDNALSSRGTSNVLKTLPKGANDSLRLEVNILIEQIERNERENQNMKRALEQSEQRAESYRQKLDEVHRDAEGAAESYETLKHAHVALLAEAEADKKALEDARAQLRAAEGRLNSSRDEADDSEIRLGEVNDELRSLRIELSEVRTALAEKEASLDERDLEHERQNNILKEKLRSAEMGGAQARQDFAVFEERLRQAEEYAEVLKREYDHQREAWNQERDTMAELQQRLSDQVAALEDQFDATREELEATKKALEEATAQRDALRVELEEKSASSDEAVAGLNEELEAARAKVASLDEALEAERSSASDLGETLNTARQSLAAVLTQRQLLDTQLVETGSRYRAQVDALREAFETLSQAHGVALGNLSASSVYAETLEERLFYASEVISRIGGLVEQISGSIDGNRAEMEIPEAPELPAVPSVELPELEPIAVYEGADFDAEEADFEISVAPVSSDDAQPLGAASPEVEEDVVDLAGHEIEAGTTDPPDESDGDDDDSDEASDEDDASPDEEDDDESSSDDSGDDSSDDSGDDPSSDDDSSDDSSDDSGDDSSDDSGDDPSSDDDSDSEDSSDDDDEEDEGENEDEDGETSSSDANEGEGGEDEEDESVEGPASPDEGDGEGGEDDDGEEGADEAPDAGLESSGGEKPPPSVTEFHIPPPDESAIPIDVSVDEFSSGEGADLVGDAVPLNTDDIIDIDVEDVAGVTDLELLDEPMDAEGEEGAGSEGPAEAAATAADMDIELDDLDDFGSELELYGFDEVGEGEEGEEGEEGKKDEEDKG